MEKHKSQNWFVLVFDVLFIMILCFGTLLTTMMMRGAVIVGGDSGGVKYAFGIGSFLITFVGLVVYLIYVILQSKKELKLMIHEIYQTTTEEK